MLDELAIKTALLLLTGPIFTAPRLYRICTKSEVPTTIAFEFLAKAIKLPTSDRTAGGDTPF
ncbi:MAG: hypothetical protein ACRDBM_13700 [Sporomusa sp.]